MRRVQYVSQKSVRESDVYALSDRDQDEFIKEVAQGMGREMRERTKDAIPLSEVVFQVTGPHNDPIQGLIHVHTMACWFDLDKMARDAPFYLEATAQEASTGENLIT